MHLLIYMTWVAYIKFMVSVIFGEGKRSPEVSTSVIEKTLSTRYLRKGKTNKCNT